MLRRRLRCITALCFSRTQVFGTLERVQRVCELLVLCTFRSAKDDFAVLDIDLVLLEILAPRFEPAAAANIVKVRAENRTITAVRLCSSLCYLLEIRHVADLTFLLVLGAYVDCHAGAQPLPLARRVVLARVAQGFGECHVVS